MRMLVFVGTLPILIKFGAKLRKELKYAGQPSRLIHVPLAAVVLPSANDLDAFGKAASLF